MVITGAWMYFYPAWKKRQRKKLEKEEPRE
jgi:hypothetical protein